jgi:hypothetical protein
LYFLMSCTSVLSTVYPCVSLLHLRLHDLQNMLPSCFLMSRFELFQNMQSTEHSAFTASRRDEKYGKTIPALSSNVGTGAVGLLCSCAPAVARPGRQVNKRKGNSNHCVSFCPDDINIVSLLTELVLLEQCHLSWQ